MLTRIALDACPHCLSGCASHPNAAGHRCNTAGCALEGYPVPYNGLAERQQVMWPKELLAFVDIARQSVEDCGCGLPKPANVDTLKTYIIEDEAGASEMCRSCLAFLRALSAWDAVGGEDASRRDAPATIEAGRHPAERGPSDASSASTVSPAGWSPATVPAPSHSHEPAPDVHAGGGAPTLGMCANAAEGVGPHERTWACGDWKPLLPDYVKPLRALSRDVLGRDALEKP